MKLLKTGFALICVIALASSCASYRSCPAYAQKPQQEIYNPDFDAKVAKSEDLRSL